MPYFRTLIATALWIGSLAANGCVVASNDPGPIYTAPLEGRLTLRWTIGELHDPIPCATEAAPVIDVQVFTVSGQSVGEYQSACDAMATSIVALAPGGYTATARLIDGQGQPRTTPVTLNPFTIRSGEELIVNIDFPASSFF